MTNKVLMSKFVVQEWRNNGITQEYVTVEGMEYDTAVEAHEEAKKYSKTCVVVMLPANIIIEEGA